MTRVVIRLVNVSTYNIHVVVLLKKRDMKIQVKKIIVEGKNSRIFIVSTSLCYICCASTVLNIFIKFAEAFLIMGDNLTRNFLSDNNFFL